MSKLLMASRSLQTSDNACVLFSRAVKAGMGLGASPMENRLMMNRKDSLEEKRSPNICQEGGA